jgi:hypothetical protein
MQSLTNASRLEQVKSAIESLDLEPIKFKISSKEDGYGWTSEHVNRIELAYRRFLVLHAQFPQHQISPTKDIDAFWHAHILDTRKYAADCQRIFGEFMHHYPYLGMRGDHDQWQQAATTLNDLFVSEFGEEVPNNAGRARAKAPAAAADKSAAWCGAETHANKSAAWCGAEAPADKSAAWCGAEAPADKSAAWCGAEAPADKSAAWCGAEAPADKSAAWCGAEAPADKSAAWCGAEAPADKSAAWCGAEAPADKSAAWCGAEAPADKSAAWCGAEAPADKSAAWCGAESPADKSAAWCGAESPADKSAAWCGAEVNGAALSVGMQAAAQAIDSKQAH